MEQTISNLEYTLKDHDVKYNPYLVHQIQSVIESLRVVMELKKTRWKHEEVEMGICPCGDCPRYDYDRFSLLLASKVGSESPSASS